MSSPGRFLVATLAGDSLTWARDAVLNWLLAHRQGAELRLVPGPARAAEWLAWLDVPYVAVEPSRSVRTELARLVKAGAAADGRLRGRTLEVEGLPIATGEPRLVDEQGAPTDLLLGALAALGSGPRLRDRGDMARTAAEMAIAEALGHTLPPVTHLSPLQTPGLSLDQLREQGFLPEVVVAALAQSSWEGPGGWAPRTRTELLVRFEASGLKAHCHLSADVLRELNRERLRELTPQELLEHSRPFWGPSLPAGELTLEERHRMEAQVMLGCEDLESLLDIPPLLAAEV